MIFPKTLFTGILLFAFFCVKIIAQQSPNTTITVKLKNNTFKQIELKDLTKKANTLVVANFDEQGKAIIKINIQNTDFFNLMLTDKNSLFLVIIPGENVKIDADASDIESTVVITDSPNSELYINATTEMKKFKNQFDAIDSTFNVYYSQNKVDSIQPILLEKTELINKKRKQFVIDLINKHSSSLSCLFFTDLLNIDDDMTTFEVLDNGLYKNYSKNIYVSNMHAKIQAAKRTALWSVAPDIKLPNPKGDSIRLSSLKGKYVLVDFWASWCGPCRKENPNVVKMYNTYHDKGFEIFSVSLDKTKADWERAIQIDKLVWTHVSELKYWDSAVCQLYGINSIPYTFLLDKNGKIIAKGLRSQELEKKLTEIFK